MGRLCGHPLWRVDMKSVGGPDSLRGFYRKNNAGETESVSPAMMAT